MKRGNNNKNTKITDDSPSRVDSEDTVTGDEEQGFSTAITDDDNSDDDDFLGDLIVDDIELQHGNTTVDVEGTNTAENEATIAASVNHSGPRIIGLELEQFSGDGDAAAPIPINQLAADLGIDTAEKSIALPEELATDDDAAPIPPDQQFDDVAIKVKAKAERSSPLLEELKEEEAGDDNGGVGPPSPLNLGEDEDEAPPLPIRYRESAISDAEIADRSQQVERSGIPSDAAAGEQNESTASSGGGFVDNSSYSMESRDDDAGAGADDVDQLQPSSLLPHDDEELVQQHTTVSGNEEDTQVSSAHREQERVPSVPLLQAYLVEESENDIVYDAELVEPDLPWPWWMQKLGKILIIFCISVLALAISGVGLGVAFSRQPPTSTSTVTTPSAPTISPRSNEPTLTPSTSTSPITISNPPPTRSPTVPLTLPSPSGSPTIPTPPTSTPIPPTQSSPETPGGQSVPSSGCRYSYYSSCKVNPMSATYEVTFSVDSVESNADIDKYPVTATFHWGVANTTEVGEYQPGKDVTISDTYIYDSNGYYTTGLTLSFGKGAAGCTGSTLSEYDTLYLGGTSCEYGVDTPPPTPKPTSTPEPTPEPTDKPVTTFPTVKETLALEPTPEPTNAPTTPEPVTTTTTTVAATTTTTTPQKMCSCSPTVFTFVINLEGNCETNDILGNPGVKESYCVVDQLQDDDDPQVTEIVSIQFLEFDTSGDLSVINQDSTYVNVSSDPLVSGDTIKFNSQSSFLDTSLPLMDQMSSPALVPGGVSVILRGKTESGEVVINRLFWLYDMNCGLENENDPVQAGDEIGWITVETISNAWPTFCPALPVAQGAVEDASVEAQTTLTDGYTLRYKLNNPDAPDGTVTMELTYDGDAWLGIAFSEDGKMRGSDGILGSPGGIPQKYRLFQGYIEIMPPDEQTLTDASVETAENGKTVMKFTKLLVEPNQIPITAGVNNMLWANGGDITTIGYHGPNRASIQIDLGSGKR